MAKYSEAHVKAKCQANPFPNDHIDPKVKDDPSFGVKVGSAIYWRHWDQFVISGHQQEIRTNRLYAQGKQDSDQYIPKLDPQLTQPGSGLYNNIDFSIVSPMPKIIDIIVGNIINTDYKVHFDAIDPYAETERSEAYDELYGRMIKHEVAKKLEEQLGVPLEPRHDFVPANEEEINLHMELGYKPDICVAMEEIVDFELLRNDWETVKKRVVRDLVENYKGFVRIWFDYNNKIRMRYVDIEHVVHPYTNDPRFNDCNYFGEVKMMSVRELREIVQKKGFQKITEEDLFKAARQSASTNGNGDWRWGSHYNEDGYYQGEPYAYDDYRIECLDFLFYSYDLKNWEWKENKYGNHHLNEKGFTYEAPKESKYNKERISKGVEMEYEGLYITCINKMGYWGKGKNMIRPRGADYISSELFKKFQGYQINSRYGRRNPIPEKVRTHLDNIQLISLKMRQVVAESTPPGIAIDVNSLNDVVIKGVDMQSMDLIKLYKQKGILIFDRQGIDGEYMNGKPIEELRNGIQDSLRPLMEAIQFEVEQIITETGIGPMDAQQPDEKALVGIQKLQILNANNAFRELFQAWAEGIYQPTAMTIARMVQDKAEDFGLKDYKPVIGKLGVAPIETLESRITYLELGIKTEMLPGAEETERLRETVNKAVEIGDITMEDSMEIMRMSNNKKAEAMLKYRKRVRQQEKIEMQRQQEEIVGQREMAVTQARSQAEAQKEQVKYDLELRNLEKEYELKMKLQQVVNEGLRLRDHIQGKNKLDQIELANELAMEREDVKEEKEDEPNIGDTGDNIPGMRDPELGTNPIGAAKDIK